MKKTSLWLVAALAATGACTKSSASSDEISDLTKRIEKLEAAQKSFSEIDGFVRPIMAQQQNQAAQREAAEHDPNARFAVDIAGNAFNGPAGAAVTIVEAFDFA